jgi:hypothetical protein
MYKVSITQLKGFKESLQESNRVLAELYASPLYEGDSNIMATILENEKQIKLITEQFKID